MAAQDAQATRGKRGGPIGVGIFNYSLSEQSARVRERADQAIRRIAERRGVGRFLRLAETRGVYAAHPLGGARMADEAGLGVVDDGGEVFRHEGLFCIDSSVIPTSLGVNRRSPSAPSASAPPQSSSRARMTSSFRRRRAGSGAARPASTSARG